MTSLPAAELEWLGTRFLDPNGRVFLWEGEIYRAIYPHRVAHILSLFEKGIVTELVERQLLISTELTKLQVDGYGLVIRHRTLPFVTKPWEWNRSFLRDAALKIIDLNLALAPWGLTTIDGHGNNIGHAECCRPIWIDFGSIVPVTNAHQPLPELRRYFTHPLEFLQRAPICGKAMRSIISGGGLGDKEIISVLHPRLHPKRAYQRLWALAGEFAAKHRLIPQQKPGTANGTGKNGGSAPSVDRHLRESILHRERERLAALRFEESYTQWGNYYTKTKLLPDDYEAATANDPRKRAILQAIRSIRPRRVIDLAANAGFFSFFAAREGADVLAVDYDEGAIERLYAAARTVEAPLSITCVCQDVTSPPATERRADLVLALALTHHLAISQKVPFGIIAARLVRYVNPSGALLVEFMTNGLGGTAPIPNPLPEHYKLENFLDALQEHFHSVQVIDYPFNPKHSRRVLILAIERKNPASP